MQPTDEQVVTFWEYFGFEPYYVKGRWRDPIHKDILHPLPDIDLENLFKYAVPKIEHFYYIAFYIVRDAIDEPNRIMWDACVCTYEKIQFKRAETQAVALFWAIWEVIKDDKT